MEYSQTPPTQNKNVIEKKSTGHSANIKKVSFKCKLCFKLKKKPFFSGESSRSQSQDEISESRSDQADSSRISSQDLDHDSDIDLVRDQSQMTVMQILDFSNPLFLLSHLKGCFTNNYT